MSELTVTERHILAAIDAWQRGAYPRAGNAERTEWGGGWPVSPVPAYLLRACVQDLLWGHVEKWEPEYLAAMRALTELELVRPVQAREVELHGSCWRLASGRVVSVMLRPVWVDAETGEGLSWTGPRVPPAAAVDPDRWLVEVRVHASPRAMAATAYQIDQRPGGYLALREDRVYARAPEVSLSVGTPAYELTAAGIEAVRMPAAPQRASRPLSPLEAEIWAALAGRCLQAGEIVHELAQKRAAAGIRRAIIRMRDKGWTVETAPQHGFWRPDAPPPEFGL